MNTPLMMQDLFADFPMREIYDNFPRLHTAIAEWVACMIFILPRTKRLKGMPLYACYAVFAGILFVTNYFNEQVDGFFWVFLMACCMAEMFCMIWICCEMTVWKALYHWAHAFMVAEFAASLEWQINCYIVYEVRWLTPYEFLYAMCGVYAAVFFLIWLLNKKSEVLKKTLHTTPRDAALVGIIAIFMFMLGNFRYMFPQATITEITGGGILFVRTLADFAGLVLLYAIDAQRQEAYLSTEVSTMDVLLRRQYEHFRLAETNNEAMHRVYHDLKHQIAFIREEPDEQKKAQYLSEMDRIISTHEAEANTGNSVLDTLLTGKDLLCLDAGITMTIYADASDIGFMDVMDICSIFGNAVDNAIEYEMQISDPDCRLIKVTVRTQNQFLLIRIDNFCQESIEINDGLIPSSKKDNQVHGYGLKSIRRSIEKYHGTLSLEQQDDWFSLIALIPIPESKRKAK